MAATRIWSIKGRLDSVINYVTNPEKTDGGKYTDTELQALADVIDYAEDEAKTHNKVYVSGINLSPNIARDQMVMTKLQFGKTDKILAYHGYQSFLPGEVTPDQAHEIGVELARRLWGDRFQILVTTHLDKEHLHNHFCLNSVSFVDGKKFRGGSKAYWQMRAESDKICAEYGLSVIKNPGKGKNYAEWKAEHENRPTVRNQIKDELDEIIKCSYTYEQFWKILKQRGYAVKRDVKYVVLKPAFSQRYIRLKSLGKNYSEEAIRQRIIAARNGIRDLDKPKSDYNAWLNKYEPTKLHGFKALYFHYLYLFGKIRKKETPQRVSFYMRDELIKFERYQKQFRFLYDNEIETVEQLTIFKENVENKIDEMIIRRSKLYDKTDSKTEIKTINAELRELRKNLRTCNNIFIDAERIREHTEYVARLEKEANEPQKQQIKDYVIG
ncbi:relaxase/mobilization nuclease domain-containing protein [Qingrenia yutianensis]|uniref:Relaxase/mobilization nuclease domain-containing protein n=1 Tax=Qingrenia yutianensis TaxID=2763676 RepID=A0A926F9A6_9FIRM|nr:relaxase/mobilization nuclease domain-containing protein [Qingrenia yutianensis]MBC8596315.1 relaxase/mobilization nuclease domain-containing protein [Qingrenia yutianensis]